jgi:hypothetical protein
VLDKVHEEIDEVMHEAQQAVWMKQTGGKWAICCSQRSIYPAI